MYEINFHELALRLCVAGLCGIVIGFERELRAKEAGVRTHFLVCLGSALIMIVSIFGFVGVTSEIPGIRGADASRIAAQIVSGIGFIGAGTIMVNRQSITGLTTAAGLWVVAGIGMAIGGGLYTIGIFSTLFVLVGLEILQMVFQRARFHSTVFTYNTREWTVIGELEAALRKNKWHVVSHSIAVSGGVGEELYQVTLLLQNNASLSDNDLLAFLRQFPMVAPERIDSQK